MLSLLIVLCVVFSGYPQQSPEIEFKANTGTSEQQMTALHQKPIYWGVTL
jgi:hypothetical protein